MKGGSDEGMWIMVNRKNLGQDGSGFPANQQQASWPWKCRGWQGCGYDRNPISEKSCICCGLPWNHSALAFNEGGKPKGGGTKGTGTKGASKGKGHFKGQWGGDAKGGELNNGGNDHMVGHKGWVHKGAKQGGKGEGKANKGTQNGLGKGMGVPPGKGWEAQQVPKAQWWSGVTKGGGKGKDAKGGDTKMDTQGTSPQGKDGKVKGDESAPKVIEEEYEMGSRFRCLAEAQDTEGFSTGFCTPKEAEGTDKKGEKDWDPALAAAGLESTLPELEKYFKNGKEDHEYKQVVAKIERLKKEAGQNTEGIWGDGGDYTQEHVSKMQSHTQNLTRQINTLDMEWHTIEGQMQVMQNRIKAIKQQGTKLFEERKVKQREIRHANLFLGKQRDEEESSEDDGMDFDEGMWMGMEQADMPDALASEVSEFNLTFAHLKRRVLEAAQNKKQEERDKTTTGQPTDKHELDKASSQQDGLEAKVMEDLGKANSKGGGRTREGPYTA
jgi:hypothetical protein